MTVADRSRWFVTTEWLAERLGDPDIVILDASWHLPTAERDGDAEYRAGHIPGAIRFDIDRVADLSTDLPHMLPAPEDFARMVGAMGIDETQRIVAYDSDGINSAARTWWTFRVMGAANVAVLEGGLPRWKAEGRPLEPGEASLPPRVFHPRFDAAAVRDLEAVRRHLAEGSAQIVDARPAARFFGEAPEPRPWVRTGRMPGSLSVPAGELVERGRLKDEDALRAAFAAGGVDLARPIVTSCGSGLNAAVVNLALETLGVSRSALYDGSWTEWGARDDLPAETGRPRSS